MNPIALEKVIQQSVQGLPDAKENGGFGASFWSMELLSRGPIIPAVWGTRRREWYLRYYDRHELNTLWQGAKAGLVNKVCGTGWTIDGGKILTNRFQRIFRGAQFEAGWDSYLTRTLSDYLVFNGGATTELIYAGNPMRPPVGPLLGLAALDSYHCLPTGDPEFPVLYYSRATATKQAAIHLMHHQRIIRMTDMEDGDQDHPGYGHSPLERALAVVQRQINLNQYVSASLDDKPAPGMVTVQGMTEQKWNAMWTQFRQQLMNDELSDWGRVIAAFSLDPTMPIKIENVSFSKPPDQFDFPVYVRVDVDELALAIGVDSQDLMPLASKAMGSGQQSEILAEKGKGKTYGHFLSLLERKLNDVLPEELEFSFKVNDPQAALQNAQIAAAWSGFTASLPPTVMSDLEKRQLLADQLEQFEKVVTDERGQLIELTDADVEPANQDTMAVDAAPNAPATTDTTQQTTAQDSTPNAKKEIQSTRLDFENDFADLLKSAREGDTNRRRFGIILRDLVRKYGDLAYRDGLKAGGVEGDLTEEDKAQYLVMLAQQSSYVTGLGDVLFNGNGITDTEANGKAQLWYDKSISPFYTAGLASADSNGLYEWVLGATEHCTDCLRMSEQKHRLKDYVGKGITPQSSNLECGGWNCQCSLKKTSGKPSGAWLNQLLGSE